MSKQKVEYNRIKEELDLQGRKATWLADQLDVHRGTVSRWCANTSQPGLENLCRIACILSVPPGSLLNDIDCEE